MQATIEIDTSPFDALIDRLSTGTDPSQEGPMRDGMLAASDAYMDAMRTRFASASAGDGTWAEHAPSTVKRRGEGAPILIDKGDLESSLTRGDAAHVLEAEGDSVTEGTSDPKARFHQDGTEHIPARPILVAPEGETLDAMGKPLASAVKQAAANPRVLMSDADLASTFGIEVTS